MTKAIIGIVSALCISVVVLTYSFKKTSETLNDPEAKVALTPEIKKPELPAPVLKYGMVLDSLDFEEHTIQRNQTLGSILADLNVSPLQVNEICDASKPVYNLANIHLGKTYKIYKSRDSLKSLKCFVYEASPMDHIVVRLSEGIEVFKDDIPVDTVRKSVGGVIESSLYQTLNSINANPDLAVRLSQIFAWQVDFFRLFKGDNFKVIYEEISVNGQPIKTGKILAASFEQHGKTFYAINFEEDGQEKYFNEEGKNVRGAFLRAPLKFFRITSRYTKKRYHPVLKRYKAHLGTDYAAPRGTPILAVGSGKVVAAAYSRYNGNYVKIKHNGTYTTQYLHMSKIANNVRKGKYVSQGQVIGYVGSTGLASGPHVCYRFWKNGKQVDPRSVNVIQTDPIKKANLPAFEIVKKEMISQLDSIVLEQSADHLAANK